MTRHPPEPTKGPAWHRDARQWQAQIEEEVNRRG
jgi:hypothetical protein